MRALKNLSSMLRRCSKLDGLVIGIIWATGVLVTTPLETTWAQTQSDPKPPVNAQGDPQAGKILFNQHCVTCHGRKGRGDGLEIAGATIADLSSPTTQRKLTIDLLTTIHEGRPGKVMPAWGYRLSQEQSRDVLAYIRTLRRN